MSDAALPSPDPADPQGFLARLLAARPRELYIVGLPDPLPKGAGRNPPKRHVLADQIQVLESVAGGEVGLHLLDGTRIKIEARLSHLVQKLTKAGYRIHKPHNDYAVRIDRLQAVATVAPPEDPPEPPLEPPEPVPPPATPLAIVRDGISSYSMLVASEARGRSLDASPVKLLGKKHSGPRYQLLSPGLDTPCPIAPGKAEEVLIDLLAQVTAPAIPRLDRPVPESAHATVLRQQRILTVGGPDFWALILKKPPAPGDAAAKAAREAEKKAFRLRWAIQRISKEEALRLFPLSTDPDAVNKPVATRNIIWQVHQWLQGGLIQSITDEEDDDQDGDWWDDDTPNLRALWYRFGKIALKRWADVDEVKDDERFNQTLTRMARRLELVRYSDFGFVDRMAKARALGTTRPHLILVTEKADMEGFTKKLAEKVGASHLILQGEPPHITMDYLTRELCERLTADGSLADRTVHAFGLCDFNAAGANILESVIEDIAYYGKPYGLRKVESHNLVDLARLPDEVVFAKRASQAHYVEQWVHVGGKKVKARKFSDGSPSFLTRVEQWFKGQVNDPRFHQLVELEGGLKEETYFGLEVNTLPRRPLVERFVEVLKAIREPVPPEFQVLASRRSTRAEVAQAFRLILGRG